MLLEFLLVPIAGKFSERAYHKAEPTPEIKGVTDYFRFAINPARDFGPRLFSAIFYGRKVFSAFNFFFWIPIVGPIGGAVCAALLYKFLFQVKTCTDSNSIQIDTF